MAPPHFTLLICPSFCLYYIYIFNEQPWVLLPEYFVMLVVSLKYKFCLALVILSEVWLPNIKLQVGYTNAGKSTLLNQLTGANVLAEDKLFATLDPTTRRVQVSQMCLWELTSLESISICRSWLMSRYNVS